MHEKYYEKVLHLDFYTKIDALSACNMELVLEHWTIFGWITRSQQRLIVMTCTGLKSVHCSSENPSYYDCTMTVCVAWL